METLSALFALCAVNSAVTGEFPAQRPVACSFDVFFDQRLNKRLSTQSWGWWFETPSRSLWRNCNVIDRPIDSLTTLDDWPLVLVVCLLAVLLICGGRATGWLGELILELLLMKDTRCDDNIHVKPRKLSRCQHCCHWFHQGSFWQQPVPLDTSKFASWQRVKANQWLYYETNSTDNRSSVWIYIGTSWTKCPQTLLWYWLWFVNTNFDVQWNLSVTTTSLIRLITCDLFSNVF